MKKKPKFVVVIPTCLKTGNTAPAITTSITYTKISDLSSKERESAINEAKQASKLSDFENWKFKIKE